MLEKPVKQKGLIDLKDYDLFWQKRVNGVVESMFQGAQHFVSQYTMNPKKVMGKIAAKLEIVPFDLKGILNQFLRDCIQSAPTPPDRANM